jgi:hypothetical protein
MWNRKDKFLLIVFVMATPSLWWGVIKVLYYHWTGIKDPDCED